ncbi:hypothetical protein BN1864_LIB5394:02951 [Pseudomonas sp. 1 R 17]|nr:hypothetical protein BN1864_LIB5394:02951 [Pseudomonas sp. 1 R 17]
MSNQPSNQQPSNHQRVQNNHRSDSLNTNRGTNGSNTTNSHVHGNRGKQLNPNQQ